ncbi:MAG: hypothetical protein JWP20_1053 [Roseomonas sp.]|jgi:hypothetical protein|nr:hypothetical protein [Roseomonas sp.]
MKAFISGLLAAVLIAIAAALVLDLEVQKPSEAAFSSGAVRL